MREGSGVIKILTTSNTSCLPSLHGEPARNNWFVRHPQTTRGALPNDTPLPPLGQFPSLELPSFPVLQPYLKWRCPVDCKAPCHIIEGNISNIICTGYYSGKNSGQLPHWLCALVSSSLKGNNSTASCLACITVLQPSKMFKAYINIIIIVTMFS